MNALSIVTTEKDYVKLKKLDISKIDLKFLPNYISENKEKFITSGLWSKSQHPNYFGEILLWSAIALLSISSLNGTQYLTLISPIFTYVLLVYISGVRMLDDMGNKKWGHLEEYKEYKRNTPTLFLKL